MKHSKQLSLTGLFEAAAVILALFSLTTLFDELHRYLELFSHFRLQYFVSSLILLLIFGFLRNRNFAVLALALALINAWTVVPWYQFEEARANGTTFTILHANLLVSNHDAERFIALVEEENPHIIVVQEMTPRWLVSLKPLNAVYPYRVLAPEDSPFGIGLFSKFPLEDVRIEIMPPLGFPEIRAKFTSASLPINIFTTHPIPPLGAENYAARNEHLAATADALPGPDEATILVGDLNISMWAAHYRQLEEKTGLRNTRRGFGIRPSWPLFFPIALIPIDHVLVSSDFVVTDMRTGPDIGSDHYPIIVTLAQPAADAVFGTR
jgi:endonuclease/exonuclease/phosphatase (EEP) superfamily protein YafD